MITDKERQEALKEINELTKEARALIFKAESIADKIEVSFYFAINYGMGGTYYPKTDNPNKEDEYGYPTEGWISSSSQC